MYVARVKYGEQQQNARHDDFDDDDDDSCLFHKYSFCSKNIPMTTSMCQNKCLLNWKKIHISMRVSHMCENERMNKHASELAIESTSERASKIVNNDDGEKRVICLYWHSANIFHIERSSGSGWFSIWIIHFLHHQRGYCHITFNIIMWIDLNRVRKIERTREQACVHRPPTISMLLLPLHVVCTYAYFY